MITIAFSIDDPYLFPSEKYGYELSYMCEVDNINCSK